MIDIHIQKGDILLFTVHNPETDTYCTMNAGVFSRFYFLGGSTSIDLTLTPELPWGNLPNTRVVPKEVNYLLVNITMRTDPCHYQALRNGNVPIRWYMNLTRTSEEDVQKIRHTLKQSGWIADDSLSDQLVQVLKEFRENSYLENLYQLKKIVNEMSPREQKTFSKVLDGINAIANRFNSIK